MKPYVAADPWLLAGESDMGSIRVDGKISLYLLVISALIVSGKSAVLTSPLGEDVFELEAETTELTMAFPGEVWETATPESQGVDSRKLEKAIHWFEDHSAKDGSSKLLIARNGRLIWTGPEVDEVQGVWSITKSLSALTMGPVFDAGKCGPDTRVADVLPEMKSAYPGMTLGHLLSMTSGYEAEGDWPPENPSYLNGGSSTPFAPDPEPQFAPGSRFSYWDSAMNVFGLALSTVAGESQKAIFQREIAEPIGMTAESFEWGKFATVGGIKISGGSGNKGKHFESSARNLARIGHLMLNRGRWGDQQVISEEWIDTITAIQVPAELPLGGPIQDLYGERFPFDGRGVYGFGWWVNGVGPDGKRLWPGCPEGTFAAVGYNNNALFVVPEWDLVVVRLGLDGTDHRMNSKEFAGLLKRIGKAIRN